jgi:hypothetical protein
MNFIINSITLLSSYTIFLSLFMAQVVITYFLIIIFKMPFWQVFGSGPSFVFTGLLLINRVSGSIFEIKKGRWKGALFSVWFILVSSGLLVNYFYRTDGITNLTDEGMVSGFVISQKGRFASGNEISGFIKGDNIEVLKGKRSFIIPAKDGFYPRAFFSYFFSVKKDFSPRFVIKDNEGKVLDTAFLIPEGFSQEDLYFRSPALPHRFYIKIEGRDSISFRITRGKLTIKKGLVKLNEELEFEGLRVSFPEIKEIFTVRIIHYPSNKVILVGSLIIFLLLFIKGIYRLVAK